MNVLKPHSRFPTNSVAVFGVGAVGFAALFAAKILNIPQIIAVDVKQSRLDLAVELGAATHVINSSNTSDLDKALMELTGGEGVDMAFDTSGVSSVINTMINTLANAGSACSVAGGPETLASIPIASFYVRGISYYGAVQGNCVPQDVSLFLTTFEGFGLRFICTDYFLVCAKIARFLLQRAIPN